MKFRARVPVVGGWGGRVYRWGSARMLNPSSAEKTIYQASIASIT
ncbi:hypothetical protein SAMN05720354_12223 [Nitrosospira sp. Nsp1]|nr:hypothetical protein SAMN05720354_12223 [Nitrosospira sp. Nsp1]